MKQTVVIRFASLLFVFAALLVITSCADWNEGFEEEILGRAPTPVEAPAPTHRSASNTPPPVVEAAPVQEYSPASPSEPLMEADLTEKSINEALPQQGNSPEAVPQQTMPQAAPQQAAPQAVPQQASPSFVPTYPPAEATPEAAGSPYLRQPEPVVQGPANTPPAQTSSTPYQYPPSIPTSEPATPPAPATNVAPPAMTTASIATPPSEATSQSSPNQRFRSIYQVSAFVHEDNAKSLRDMLSDRGHESRIEPSAVKDKTYYRVLVTLEGTTEEMLGELSEIGVTEPKLVTQTPIP